MNKDLYRMGLHERISPSTYYSVIRVPGGWIYEFEETHNYRVVDRVFVPYNNEFDVPVKVNTPEKLFCTICEEEFDTLTMGYCKDCYKKYDFNPF